MLWTYGIVDPFSFRVQIQVGIKNFFNHKLQMFTFALLSTQYFSIILGLPYTITGTSNVFYRSRGSSSEKLVDAMFLTISASGSEYGSGSICEPGSVCGSGSESRMLNEDPYPPKTMISLSKTVPLKGWVNYLDIDLVGEAAPGTEGPYAGEVMLTRPDTN
jgi:hypothetical protein